MQFYISIQFQKAQHEVWIAILQKYSVEKHLASMSPKGVGQTVLASQKTVMAKMARARDPVTDTDVSGMWFKNCISPHSPFVFLYCNNLVESYIIEGFTSSIQR